MKLEVNFVSKGKVEDYIESCEGKHIQQVIYSTYHKTLTQICFGCKIVRTSLKEKDTHKKISDLEDSNGCLAHTGLGCDCKGCKDIGDKNAK